MKKMLLIIALVLTGGVSLFAQNGNGKEIGNGQIEWSDFTGEVDDASDFDAMTYWTITYKFSAPTFKNGRAQTTVTTRIFLRADSWVKPDKKSARLLEHERGHFKIGQLCAREIEETLSAESFDSADYAQEIDRRYWEIIEKYKQIEKQYDEETEHYRNREQQALWNKKLHELLNQ